MTKALENAFAVASRLPETEQDALAAAILDDIQTESRWEKTLEGSSAALGKLADEALEDHQTGRTEPLDLEKL